MFDLYDDADCVDFAQKCAKDMWSQYIKIVSFPKFELDDFVQEAVLTLMQIRSTDITGDCSAFCWVAMQRRIRRVVDNSTVVRIPDYRSKSISKELRDFYIAGNEVRLDAPLSDESDLTYKDTIYSKRDFTVDVLNHVLVEQLFDNLNEQDSIELYRWMHNLSPISRKRRENLPSKCLLILKGKSPYKVNHNKYPGVEQKSETRWRAYIIVNRKKVGLGSFSSPEDAYQAVLNAKGVN